MILLQIDTIRPVIGPIAQDTMIAASQTIQKTHELTVLDLLQKGGFVMIPLLILAFLGLIIFVERYLTISKASKNESNLMVQIKQKIIAGKLDDAIDSCRNNNTPLGRMLQKGLIRIGRPIKEIEGAIENIGKLEVS